MVPFSPDMLKEIRTRFVRDRLREMSFKDRNRFAELVHFEDLAVARIAGERLGWAGGSFYGQFRQAQPVEAECIERELREGIYTPPEEYRRLLREHRRAVRREAAEAAAARRRSLEDERKAWIEAGGRP